MKSCLIWATAAVGLAVSGCGGGGNTPPTPAAPPPAGAATANLLAPSDGRTEWNRSTPLQVSLKDAAGATIANPSCTSANTTALTVAADCSSINGQRIGSFAVTVSGGGVSQDVLVKVIPQRVVIATNQASSYGSGGYNVVVTPDGKLLAWGANPFGVLGQGLDIAALTHKALPVAVKDSSGSGELSGIVAASAGDRSVLALTEDGEVYIWGGGSALAFTTKNEVALPTKVPNSANSGPLARIVAVSAGDNNSVALADDGTVYTWGEYTGQGGAGADSAVYPAQVKSPSGNSVLQDIVAVAAGWNYSLALTRDGGIAAWGFASSGATGAAVAGNVQALPRMIQRASDGSDLTGMVSLSAGYNFALALSPSGSVYAWGSNSWGQLGQGVQYGTYLQAVTVKDPAGTAELSGIASVSAGGNHGLALDNEGKVFSWGYSQDGELGDGANHPRVNQGLLPAAVVGTDGTGQLAGITGVASGFGHSLALADDGRLLIWGTGFRGNLGQGEAANHPDSFVPLAVKAASGTAQLSLAPLTVTRGSYRRYR